MPWQTSPQLDGPLDSRELSAWCRSIFRALIMCHWLLSQQHKLNLRWQCNCSNFQSSLPNAFSNIKAKGGGPARGRKSKIVASVFHRIGKKIRLIISSAHLFCCKSLKLPVTLVLSSVHWMVKPPLLQKSSQFWWAGLEQALGYLLWQPKPVGHLCFYQICFTLHQIQQAQEYVSMLWFLPFFFPMPSTNDHNTAKMKVNLLLFSSCSKQQIMQWQMLCSPTKILCCD